MSKFSFTPLTADRASVSKINSILEDIEANFARVVYRDEATSNSLQTDLDFNGNSLVNVGVNFGEALATKTYVDSTFSSQDADDISYDNTGTTLVATNVGAALNELATAIDLLNKLFECTVKQRDTTCS